MMVNHPICIQVAQEVVCAMRDTGSLSKVANYVKI